MILIGESHAKAHKITSSTQDDEMKDDKQNIHKKDILKTWQLSH